MIAAITTSSASPITASTEALAEAAKSAWDETSELQRDLADKGWHQSASPVDLLMAVTARHHKLTVLHADADFDTISRLTGQPSRWIS
ncbi:PIN domain-containing protein [Streptosporangium sp. CA-115845]|uniref:PIN domain-containing protein n=1 Tax=Streptosporangium sp. CA-115845 TaxID=3240071 RepID=UPI003D917AF3